MSQHDYELANAPGASFRVDLNNALLAVVSQNSGATAPATTFAYQLWMDTATGLLKIRNAANNAWVTIGDPAEENLGMLLVSDIGSTVQAYVAPGTSGNVLTSNGSAWVSSPNPSGTDKIQPITASVAGNALTVTLNPTKLDFRSATLGSGSVNTRDISSSISVTVSSGSTLGTVSGQQSRIAVLAIDNAGTVELAVVNIAGGNALSETGLISTTAEGGAGAADSASTIYSTTARSNVPYRVVGYVESTQSTAGTWATAPSTIQGYGGQALAAMSSLGYGQTWQDVKTSPGRSLSTTYYNTTGKPISVAITIANNVAGFASYIVNGVTVGRTQSQNAAAVFAGFIFTVPPGGSYSCTGGGAITDWTELR